MTVPTWPTELPGWISDGYGLQRVDPNARTNMDSGVPRVRRRFITTPTTCTLKVMLTQTQFAAFEAWWINDAFDGSSKVMLPITNGVGTASCLCQFTEMYQASQSSGALLWSVTVTALAFSLPVTNG